MVVDDTHEPKGFFLSYNKECGDFVEAVARALGARGCRPLYFDRHGQSGVPIEGELLRSLACREVLVAFVTDAMLGSASCRGEVWRFANAAFERGRLPRVVSVQMRDCEQFESARGAGMTLGGQPPKHLTLAAFLASYQSRKVGTLTPEELAEFISQAAPAGDGLSTWSLGGAGLLTSFRLTSREWGPLKEVAVHGEGQLQQRLAAARRGDIVRVFEPLVVRALKVPKGVGLVAEKPIQLVETPGGRRRRPLLEIGGWAFNLEIESASGLAVAMRDGGELLNCRVSAAAGPAVEVDAKAVARIVCSRIEGNGATAVVTRGAGLSVLGSEVSTRLGKTCIEVANGTATVRDTELLLHDGGTGVFVLPKAALRAAGGRIRGAGNGVEVAESASAELVDQHIANSKFGVVVRGSCHFERGTIKSCGTGIHSMPGSVLSGQHSIRFEDTDVCHGGP